MAIAMPHRAIEKHLQPPGGIDKKNMEMTGYTTCLGIPWPKNPYFPPIHHPGFFSLFNLWVIRQQTW